MVKTHAYTLEEVAEAFDGPDGAVTRLDKLWTERTSISRREQESDQESSKKSGEGERQTERESEQDIQIQS